MGTTYGLSFQGIEEVLKLNQLSHVKVVKDLQTLQKIFSELEGKTALIVDASLLKSVKTVALHVISVFAERKEGVLKIFINDSIMNFNEYSEFFMKDPFGLNVKVFISNVERQKPSEVTCNAIAITDVMALEANAKIIDELEKGSQKVFKDVYKVKALPKAMHTLSDSLVARKKALEFQFQIIKSKIPDLISVIKKVCWTALMLGTAYVAFRRF